MLLFILLAALVSLVALLIAGTVLRRLNIVSEPGETIRIPAHLGWSLLLAAIAVNIFAYNVEFGIGFGLFGVCVMVAIMLLFPSEKRTAAVWFLGIVGIIACLLFGVRANE